MKTANALFIGGPWDGEYKRTRIHPYITVRTKPPSGSVRLVYDNDPSALSAYEDTQYALHEYIDGYRSKKEYFIYLAEGNNDALKTLIEAYRNK